MISRVLLPFVAAVATAQAKLVQLDIDNFESTVAPGNVLVKFFAPWCGHCKKMAPDYEAAAEELAAAGNSKAIIAEVDCNEEKNKPLMGKYGVRGFPTLVWFDADGNQVPYNSGRDKASIKAFVTSNQGDPTWYGPYLGMAKSYSQQAVTGFVGLSRKFYLTVQKGYLFVMERAPSIVVEETGSNWGNEGLVKLTPKDIHLVVARQNVLVKFFAPWCGHCKNMAPAYEEAATIIHKENAKATIAEFDCTQEGGNPICAKYGVRGFPTLKWFHAGGSVVEYSSGRDKESVMNWIKAHVGDVTLGAKLFSYAQKAADTIVEHGQDAFKKGKKMYDDMMAPKNKDEL